MQKHLRCLVCSSDKLAPLAGYHEMHGLVKCRVCGLVFMERIPATEELDRHYSNYAYTSGGYLSPITVASYHLLLDEFEKYRVKNTLLDVGCGRGWFLLEARKRGWDVYGTEYSDAALTLGRAQGLTLKAGALDPHSFSTGFFDVITSFEVLEHINNPVEETTCIFAFLRKGGLFYCTTPNFNAYLRYYLKAEYNIIEYPEHLTYYTRRTLRKLLRDRGFRDHKIQTTGISISRLRSSGQAPRDGRAPQDTADERLRQQINGKWYLRHTKTLVNSLLTLLGLGMTLKGYFQKE